VSPNQPDAVKLPTLADHADRLKNLTKEARSNPQRLERILSDIDHVASVIADIAAVAT